MAAKQEEACAEKMLKADAARATCARAGCGTRLQKPLQCARCKAVTYCSKGKCSRMLAMSLCVPGFLIPSLLLLYVVARMLAMCVFNVDAHREWSVSKCRMPNAVVEDGAQARLRASSRGCEQDIGEAGAGAGAWSATRKVHG